MGRMCVMIIWLSITSAMGDANRVEDVVSITGCSATLEWILAATYEEAYVHSITVINANGRKIAEKKEMTCQNWTDSSIYCEVRNTNNKEWRFVVVLFNVTQASSGNYTGQIKTGTTPKINSTMQLKVIEKPKIKEVQTSILHEPLRIKCSVDSEFKDRSYKWKLNGTYLNSTDRMDTTSSNLTYENLTMADKLNMFSCIACSDNNCCIESETYVPDPYYGPESVTLSFNDSDIYLHANEKFNINCSAKCNPLCYFKWDGYVSSQNEELVINNFDSRMAGAYSCTTTNNKTGVTVKSKQITFHYVRDSSATSSSLGDNGDSSATSSSLGDNGDSSATSSSLGDNGDSSATSSSLGDNRDSSATSSSLGDNGDSSATSSSLRDNGDLLLKLLGIGLFIAAVSLVTVGVLLVVTNRRKYASRRLGSQTVNEPCAVSSNRALNQGLNFNIRDRPLPIPVMQERTCRMMIGSSNHRLNRKSRSCGAFFDNNHDSWNPVRQTLSLQTLMQLSHEIGRRVESDESIIKSYCSKKVSRCSINGPGNGIMLEEQYSKVRNNKQISDIQHNSSERLHRLNNFQENEYSTVDETSLSVYDYARETTKEGNLQTIHCGAEAASYDSDYDYATLQ